MSECCTTQRDSEKHPRTHFCPANGKQYKAVDKNTLLHHVKNPWGASITNQGYYFCSDPDCNIVYFGQNNITFSKYEVLTQVWEKESDMSRLVCYCFHVTHQQAGLDSDIKRFVIQKTKESYCSCETSNPSGRCCLKNFPKH